MAEKFTFIEKVLDQIFLHGFSFTIGDLVLQIDLVHELGKDG